ncbi:MAG TPA: hypothetical protein DCL77_09010 [Prolixibacteraceae bacterium]|jgi:hypothetical protein|nr:hypothetical protein [Prolixibacteraceae bacterium]
MNPIRHPKDFSSLAAYMADIARIKERLANEMLAKRRRGDCIKSILHILRYLRVMMFWVSGPVKTVFDTKAIQKPLTGSLSIGVFEYPAPNSNTYGSLAMVLLKDDTNDYVGNLSVGVFEYPVPDPANYGTLATVLLKDDTNDFVGSLNVGVFEYDVPDATTYGTLAIVLLYDDQL